MARRRTEDRLCQANRISHPARSRNCCSDAVIHDHGPPQALLFGPPSIRTPLEKLLADSYWAIEHQTDLRTVVDRLSGGHFPVVCCPVEEWKRVAKALAKLDRRPMIVAVVSDNRLRKEWIQTLQRNVYSVNIDPLARSKLIPLLNHALRAWYRPRRTQGTAPRDLAATRATRADAAPPAAASTTGSAC